MTTFNKLVRDGKVGVIISPGFGAGWYSWNSGCGPAFCMDDRLVKLVLEGKHRQAKELAEQLWPNCYTGSDQLEVAWVPQGEQFEICEYDGNESLNIISQNNYLVA